MDAESRHKKIKQTTKKASAKIGYLRKTLAGITMDNIYAIPVRYLIFNQYNARIGSFIRTYRRTRGNIDPSTEEGEKQIMNFLWRSDPSKNKATSDDIEQDGQKVPGIITSDGVIIDGNRRCLILKRLVQKGSSRHDTFNCYVLSQRLDKDPQTIRKLEMAAQFEDDKASYNPIEKYLRCRELKDFGMADKEIAHLMKEKNEASVRTNLAILKLMDEYLRYIEADEMYEWLTVARLEGPFFDMHNYLRKPHSADWIPNKRDFVKLKIIMFDLIRSGLRKELRDIIKKDGAFAHKKIWDRLVRNHQDKIIKHRKNEKPTIDYINEEPDLPDVERTRKRENAYIEVAGSNKEGDAYEVVSDMKNDLYRENLTKLPSKLLGKARDDMQTLVDKKFAPLTDPNQKKILQEIKELANHLSGKKK